MSYYVEWRALVGPRYNHYPWYNLTYGSTNTLDFLTYTTNQVVAATANIEVPSTSFFVANSALWLAPNGSTESWEYVRYASMSGIAFGSLTRDLFDSAQTGLHTLGATVRQWYPIETDDGTFRLTEEMDGTFSAVTWRASIRGVRFPQWALRNNHLIVIQTRTSHLSPWSIQLVGVLDSPTVKDDWQDLAEWSVTIRSLDSLWTKQPVRGVRVGNLNVAKAGTATGSTPLVTAYEERGSGDFTKAEPTFDASQTIDGDLQTLWIADRFMGTPVNEAANGDPLNGDGVKFNQLYLNPPPGTPPGARWIELIMLGGSFRGLSIVSANGSGQNTAKQWDLTGNSGLDATPDYKPRILLVEDQDIFSRLNPTAAADHIIEMSRVNNDGARENFFTHLRAAGGDLWLRIAQSGQWLSRVAWGDGNWNSVNDRWPQHSDAPNTPYPLPTMNAPGVGQTIRYMHLTYLPTNVPPGRQFWQIGFVKSPGYKINTSPDAWVQITLPGLGLKLLEDTTINQFQTGFLLKIGDDGGANTSGLPASGILQVGAHQFSYSSKTENGVVIDNSAANGTIVAVHNEGDLVYLVDSGTPTDGQLINSVGWNRYLGTNNPRNFTVRYSKLPGDVRNPESSDWQNDWIILAGFSNYNSNVWSSGAIQIRAKHLLLQIERMTQDPSRPRMNEITAMLDSSVYHSNTWLGNTTGAFGVIRQVLVNAGFPTEAITTNGQSPALGETTTAAEKAWPVAVDLAEFANCQLVVGRDSRITIQNNLLWVGGQQVGFVWNRANAASVEATWRNGIGVSQVKLAWKQGNGAEGGEVVYPATAETLGDVLEIEELRYASSASAEAAAQRKYIVNRYPYTVQLESADGVPTFRPGGVCELNWQFNTEMQALRRFYVVTSADHSIEENQWYTSCTLQQIERLAED